MASALGHLAARKAEDERVEVHQALAYYHLHLEVHPLTQYNPPCVTQVSISVWW